MYGKMGGREKMEGKRGREMIKGKEKKGEGKRERKKKGKGKKKNAGGEKKKKRSGESGHRSRYLSHAKRALYHVS